MTPKEFENKVKQAAESDKYVLRDGDGVICWVDTVDDHGAYYHTDEGDTYRASWEQLHSWFTVLHSSDYSEA